MDRRVFMRSGAMALVTMGLNPSFLRRTTFGMTLPKAAKGKVLICIFQRGAADALNVVVPHGDPRVLPVASEHRDRTAIAGGGVPPVHWISMDASGCIRRCDR